MLVTSLVAGCSSAPEGPATTKDPATSSGTGAAAKTGSAVPATFKFTGRTLDGKAFDANTLAGKPAILWFWAPWCATCASEAQSIVDIQDEYAGKLNILGVAGMGDNASMRQFVTDLSVYDVPHLDDGAGKIWKRFGITQQSTYVLVDRVGRIVKTGYLDDLQLTAEVRKLTA